MSDDNNSKNSLFNSKILKNEEIQFLESCFKRNFTAELLYCSEIHERNPKTFHEKCDDIPNTLIIVKSDTEKRFGGFTKLTWSTKEGFVQGDGSDFIFSLDRKRIFLNNNKTDCAIYNHPNCFPCFGAGCDVGLLGDCFVNNQSAHTYLQTSYGNGEDLGEGEISHFYLADSDEYQVENLEIYKIEFAN